MFQRRFAVLLNQILTVYTQDWAFELIRGPGVCPGHQAVADVGRNSSGAAQGQKAG